MDLLPDLQEVSDSSVLGDSESVSEVGGNSEDDWSVIELTIDEGDEAYTTTFGCAMLANIKGSVDGVMTELYDSGASRHMSPYCEQFENYISIIPKSITAADKRYFQAIGKGDLRIQVPNSKTTTTIPLRDILHCPDMGLTLVAISQVAAAGFPTLFRGSTCRIFDSKRELIGQIPVRNGLYRVDHEGEDSGGGMGGMAKEVLMVEELHWQMGHITPEAAKRLVTEGAVEGIELDTSGTLQSCDSCEYAKAT